jgi:hypothetical protein
LKIFPSKTSDTTIATLMEKNKRHVTAAWQNAACNAQHLHQADCYYAAVLGAMEFF